MPYYLRSSIYIKYINMYEYDKYLHIYLQTLFKYTIYSIVGNSIIYNSPCVQVHEFQFISSIDGVKYVKQILI